MFGDDRPARGDVVRERDIACGVDVRTDVRMCSSMTTRPSCVRQARRSGEPDVWAHAGRGEWHGGRTGGEHQVPVRVVRTACGDHFLRGDVDALDAHPADEADVVAVEPAGAVEIEVGLAPA